VSFVYPNFLWALTALAIPILIHLFHFRRYKKIQFSNVALLKEVQKQNQSVKNLKNWLVLLFRLLAIAFLVFAFAQPFIPSETVRTTSGKKPKLIYLDNSYSMSHIGQEGELFAKAKEKARDILNAYDAGDEFLLLTNSGSVSGRRSLSRSDALLKLESIQMSAVNNDLNTTLERIQYLTEQKGAFDVCYVLSDFQKTEAITALTDSVNRYDLVLFKPEEVQNISIDSVWLEDPIIQLNRPLEFKVRLTVHGNRAAQENTINLLVDGEKSAVVGVDLNKTGSQEVSIGYTPSSKGWHACELNLEDQPIRFDNRYFFNFYVKPNSRIVIITDQTSSPYLEKVYGLDEFYSVKRYTLKSLQPSELEKSDVIVLDQAGEVPSGTVEQLAQFLANGGSLVVFPSKEAKNLPALNRWGRSLGMAPYGKLKLEPTKISTVQTNDPFYEKVFERIPKSPDLPKVLQHYELKAANQMRSRSLLKLANRTDFMVKTSVGQGVVYQFACPQELTWTNFMEHGIFVPTMLKMGLGSSRASTFSSTIAQENYVGLYEKGSLDQASIQLQGQDKVWTPVMVSTSEENLLDCGQDVVAGNFELVQGDSLIQLVSFNDSRKESVETYADEEELETAFADVRMQVQGQDTLWSKKVEDEKYGKRFWKWCVILSLLFVAFEILLLRFFANRVTTN
jgi:hypothetical protein